MKQRCDRTTVDQLKCFVRYCKENPDIVRYQGLSSYKNAPPQVKELWQKLTNELNRMRGPTRSLKRWKDSLYQWRKQARFRMRKLKARGHTDVADTPYKQIMLYDHQILEESINARSKKTENNVHKGEPEDDVEYAFDSVYVPDEKVDRSSPPSSPVMKPIDLNGTAHSSMTEAHSDCSFLSENEPDDNECTQNSQREECRTRSEERAVQISSRKRKHSEESDTGQNENLAEICKKLVKSLEKREQRDERLFTQQQSVIAKLDQTLLLMTQVLVKLNDKLDKL